MEWRPEIVRSHADCAVREMPECRPRQSGQLPFFMPYGIYNGMNARIDKSGRIVVPKPLRERLGLKPDTEFELVERADGVLLRRVEQRPSMLKVDGLWVHQGTAVPGANWARVVDDVREERVDAVLKA
jgi:AbrB family looped-hinge helix DNA binding protein